MAYDVTQIYNIANSAANDALGKNAGVTKLATHDFVSLGKQLSELGLVDGWFGALSKRISKTVYFARTYEGKRRSVLRDEQEWGAFIQKVYYKMPSASQNDTWYQKPSDVSPYPYNQASPYGVTTSVEVKALIFGGKGTWTVEIVRPLIQIKNAFLSESAMFAFIDGIYVTIENAFKLEEERLEALAVNTGMALSISRGKAINVLNLYNMDHDNAVITASEALKNAEFHRRMAMEIGLTIDNMKMLNTSFSPFGWETFTPEEKLVVEVLGMYAKAADVYLQADTYHNTLIQLPNYERVAFWQSSGNNNFAFEDISKINIEHDDLQEEDVYASDTVTQGGILAYVHDLEAVACAFYDKRTWEMVNPRAEVLNHGDKAEKGYAVDGNANGVVFFVEDTNPITVSGDNAAVLKYTHAYAGQTNHITTSKTPTATGITFTSDGAGGYTFVMPSNAAIAITCS